MSDERAIIGTFIGTLIGFKIITSIMVFYYFPSWYTMLVLAAVNAVWILPIFYFAPRYFRSRYRMWNIRLRRRRLIEQEWNVEHPSSSTIDRR